MNIINRAQKEIMKLKSSKNKIFQYFAIHPNAWTDTSTMICTLRSSI